MNSLYFHDSVVPREGHGWLTGRIITINESSALRRYRQLGVTLWTRRHPNAVAGIVYMEALIKPSSWNEISEQGRKIIQALQSSEGEKMIL